MMCQIPINIYLELCESQDEHGIYIYHEREGTRRNSNHVLIKRNPSRYG